jgi:hypothetical protein
MTNPIPYDGTGKLSDALAALFGLSPKSHNKLAALIQQAKDGLGITSKAKVLPDDVKLAIYRWHYGRLHPATNETVEIIQQPEPVETISQANNGQSVETFSQHDECKPVEIISQDADNEAVEINSQYDMNDLARIAFYTSSGGVKKRQVIALDGFYINALMTASGVDKKGVPAWVQQAVDGWGAFDPALPITKQVKFLIVRELTNAICR